MLNKIRSVEKLFQQLEKKTLKFQSKSKLSCATGCNLCCLKTDIYASVLEMLPMAYHLYKIDRHFQVCEEIEKNPKLCVSLSMLRISESNYGCQYYAYRGMICRLFGFSGLIDKYNHTNIYSCKTIKDGQSEQFKIAVDNINKGNIEIAMASEFQMQLNNIDPSLASDENHINISLYKAIEKVALYFDHKPKRNTPFRKVS